LNTEQLLRFLRNYHFTIESFSVTQPLIKMDKNEASLPTKLTWSKYGKVLKTTGHKNSLIPCLCLCLRLYLFWPVYEETFQYKMFERLKKYRQVEFDKNCSKFWKTMKNDLKRITTIHCRGNNMKTWNPLTKNYSF
jgi:hypothetical protein